MNNKQKEEIFSLTTRFCEDIDKKVRNGLHDSHISEFDEMLSDIKSVTLDLNHDLITVEEFDEKFYEIITSNTVFQKGQSGESDYVTFDDEASDTLTDYYDFSPEFSDISSKLEHFLLNSKTISSEATFTNSSSENISLSSKDLKRVNRMIASYEDGSDVSSVVSSLISSLDDKSISIDEFVDSIISLDNNGDENIIKLQKRISKLLEPNKKKSKLNP